ncbi:MAG: hypothetical protein ACW98Y_15270 [Candidatus Thorarchaeota archaeon]
MRRGSLKGYQGKITRVVKIRDTKKEFFISGHEDITFEEALEESWPFDDRNVKDKWRVVSSSGEDLTKRKLGSHSDIVILEFI